jgi:hypothetical protein
MKVKGNHPLAEVVAKKMFGAAGCPPLEIDRMVNHAARAAVEYHESEMIEKAAELDRLREALNTALVLAGPNICTTAERDMFNRAKKALKGDE